MEDQKKASSPNVDEPIRYMERTRNYYLALGYDNPYVWAHHNDAPLTLLTKPLAETKVTLITTAARYQSDKGDQGPGAPYNSGAKFYKVYSMSVEGDPDVRVSHVAIDRAHTTAVDKNTWFPLVALKRSASANRIGGISSRFHGLPTNRSQETTLNTYCPDLLSRVREDGADTAILVANCPVCHQSVSLAARYLEDNGIPTVIMGCAKDIVEHAGVPRFLFSDFPLGNAAGRPNDIASQDTTLELSLDLLESARAPRTTVHSPLRWSDDPSWKFDYSNANRLSPEELARRRAEFDKGKEVARKKRVESVT